MSIDAIRAKIDSLKTDKATRAVMYFLLKNQNQYQLREVDLTPDTQSEVTLNTLHDISEFFEGEYALRDLTAADQREGVIYNYNLNEKPVQLELLEQGRRQKLSATPDLSGTVLPLCLIPNSALKSAPPFKSVVPKASACAGLPA